MLEGGGEIACPLPHGSVEADIPPTINARLA
jgi:hypothetical protein